MQLSGCVIFYVGKWMNGSHGVGFLIWRSVYMFICELFDLFDYSISVNYNYKSESMAGRICTLQCFKGKLMKYTSGAYSNH